MSKPRKSCKRCGKPPQGRGGLSTAVQTTILIVVTASLTALALALWRPWEAGQQALAGSLSEAMMSLHEILTRREGTITPQLPILVYPHRELHKIEVEWNGQKMPIPVSVSTFEYRGSKMRIPNIYYLDKGSVDALGSYIAGGKKNYTTSGADVVSYVEYGDKEMRYVVKPLPYVNVAVDRIYHDVVVNVMVKFVILAPAPLNSEAFLKAVRDGYVIAAGQKLTINYNNTVRYYMQQPESVDGGTLKLYVDDKPVETAPGKPLEYTTNEKTIVRIFVDVVILNVWGR